MTDAHNDTDDVTIAECTCNVCEHEWTCTAAAAIKCPECGSKDFEKRLDHIDTTPDT